MVCISLSHNLFYMSNVMIWFYSIYANHAMQMTIIIDNSLIFRRETSLYEKFQAIEVKALVTKKMEVHSSQNQQQKTKWSNSRNYFFSAMKASQSVKLFHGKNEISPFLLIQWYLLCSIFLCCCFFESILRIQLPHIRWNYLANIII